MAVVDCSMGGKCSAAPAAPRFSRAHIMAEPKGGKDPCFGCGSIGQKIFAHSSSESLEAGGMLAKKAWRRSSSGGSSLKKRLLTMSPSSIADKFKKSSSSSDHEEKPKQGLGTLSGVLIPTMENMWGVLIFLRFYYIVGNAGVWQSFLIVFLSFMCAILTTMSLSAVATNGPIEEGGTYFIISRALGPKLGGTVGIMYYLGVALLAVLESLGAVEMLTFTFTALDFNSANRILGAMILLVLCFLVFFGISFVSKLSMVFFLVVLYAMASYYLGLFTAPRGHAPENLTGLKWSTFKGNWNSGYDKDVSFPVALAIFFPCYTGILSGADRAKNLAHPAKSIPRGTIGAVTISLVMYLSYMGLWSAVGTRDYLLGRNVDGSERSTHAEGQNLEVVKDVAFPLAILTQLGIIIASMAQAFQCLITSPRLLQAIASDGVIPPLRRFAKISKNGEPRAALLATCILSLCAAMIGSLDAVAPLVSICFLTAYAALNFSCFVLSLLKAPSWRPKWKFYHWSAALLGFLLCFAVNFVVKWYWAIIAVVVQVFIYIYIDYRQVEVDWGTGLGGLRLQLAVRSILSVGHEARYSVNWRPQLLCLCKPRSARAPDDHNNLEFMSFVSQLKKGRGLCVVATIIEGTLEKMAPQVEAERLELENTMQTAGVTGFARVLVAPSYNVGKTYAIQSSGLGALEPNTLVLGWPNKWYEDGHYHSAKVMLEILDECKAVDKAVVLCMNLDEFPTEGTQQEGYIDVWWVVHDGGLLLILAHLLIQHRIWRKCKLRVHTVSEQIHDPTLVKKNLKLLLDKVRIQAEVHVIDMDTGGLAPYTYDTTIRIEEARAFAEEVANYRSAYAFVFKFVAIFKYLADLGIFRERTVRNVLETWMTAKCMSQLYIAWHSLAVEPARMAQEQQKRPELSKQVSSKGLTHQISSKLLTQQISSKDLEKHTSGKDHTKQGSTALRKDSVELPRMESVKSPPLSRSPTRRASEHEDRPSVGDVFKGRASEHDDRPSLGDIFKDKPVSVFADSIGDKEEYLHEEGERSPINAQGQMIDSKRFEWYYGHEQGKHDPGEQGSLSRQERNEEKPQHVAISVLTKTQSGRNAETILKRAVPTELSMLEGVEHHSRARNTALHSLRSAGSHSKEHANVDLPPPTASKGAKESKEGGASRQGRQEDSSEHTAHHSMACIHEGRDANGGERSSPRAQPNSSSESKRLDVQRPEQLSILTDEGSKKMRWADELDDSGVPEIIVEGDKENDDDGSNEGSGRRGLVRTGSAGQLYPGSPHGSDVGAASEIPEVVNRTWEMFSQNYSPKKLNEIIMEQSKDAQLVLLNLPDHYKGMEPSRYMEYCEDVTRGLRRVLLVHGTGREMWNAEQM